MSKETYAEFAKRLARDSGEIILDHFHPMMEKSWKADTTPLTEADTTINQNVIDAVNDAYPDHNVLAEEGSDMHSDSEYVWVCDPVDGTTPYSHGVPNAVFSLALVKDGEPVVSVVYDPFADRLYAAKKNNGCTVNGEKVTVADERSPKPIIGVTLSDSELLKASKLAPILEEKGYNVLDLGSIVYMSMLVASGQFAASIFPYPYPHDAAAAKLLVDEAGGITSDIYGEEQRYDQDTNGFIYAAPHLYDEIRSIIASKTA